MDLMIVAAVITGMLITVVLFLLLTRTGHIRLKHEGEAGTRLALSEDRLQRLQEEHLLLKEDKAATDRQLLQVRQRLSETEAAYRTQTESLDACKASYARSQEQVQELTSSNSNLSARYQALSAMYDAMKGTYTKQEEVLEQVRHHNQELRTEHTMLTAANKALEDKLASQKKEIEVLHKNAYFHFEKIANQLLEEKSGRFTETNRAHIEALLKPLGENIDSFKRKVEETYDKESRQRFSLEEKVRELIEQTNKVSSEANNLANALKGQAKRQGDWGEMILESVLQQSGLTKNREYFLQQPIRNEEGRMLRPDVLIRLPDDRMIIVDSKVSLTAYDRLTAAETPEEQATCRSAHIKSVYRHIDDLCSKQYDNLETALDFTMIFIPIEPAYLAAIQADPGLWAYAYSKRILLISPTNLIACLKLIADLWKRELQSKNAQEIVRRGELLYEKAVSFVSTMEDIGKHIHKLQHAYQAATEQLHSGQGNLVRQALMLRDLGLKSSKEMPAAMLPPDFDGTGNAEEDHPALSPGE